MTDAPEEGHSGRLIQAREPSGTPRIAAVVLNTVVRDARVLKEADALAAEGYSVTIFGLDDPCHPEPVLFRPSGVRIVRVHPRSATRVYLTVLPEGVSWWGTAAGVALIVGAAREARKRHHLLSILLALSGAVSLGLTVFARRLERSRSAPGTAPVRESNGATAANSGKQVVPPATSDGPHSNAQGEGRRHGWLRIRRHVADGLKRRARQRLLVHAVEDFRPDVVHCHDLIALPVGVAHRRRHDSKVVYDSHEIFEEVSGLRAWRRLRYRLLQHKLSRHVDAFVTVNDSIRSFLNDRYPQLPVGIVVKNAVPRSTVAAQPSPLRESLGLTEEHKVLLFQGGLAPHRGLEQLVRSARLLPDKWVVVLMGAGVAERSLRALADTHGDDRVHFLPEVPQEELRSWTAGADLGAIPYDNVCLNHWYCSPNKLWEYPAAGVPVLASPYPELRTTIEDYGIGRLLDGPPTAARIAAAIQQIEESDLETMQEACLQFARSDSWELYRGRLTMMYHSLLDSRQSNEVFSRTQRL